MPRDGRAVRSSSDVTETHVLDAADNLPQRSVKVKPKSLDDRDYERTNHTHAGLCPPDIPSPASPLLSSHPTNGYRHPYHAANPPPANPTQPNPAQNPVKSQRSSPIPHKAHPACTLRWGNPAAVEPQLARANRTTPPGDGPNSHYRSGRHLQ